MPQLARGARLATRGAASATRGSYPAVPTLVLSGELDSITTPAEGAIVAAQFPAARQVIVANSFHVTAEDATDTCAVRILRKFVTRPRTGLTAKLLACAHEVPPLRAVADYPRSYRDGSPARSLPGSGVGSDALHASAGAVRTVSDLLTRWLSNYSGAGHGLQGGTWTYTGDHVVHFKLTNVRLMDDLAVSGRVTWSRYRHRVVAHVDISQARPHGDVLSTSPVTGHLDLRWNDRALGARALIEGRLGGHPVVADLRAP